MFSIGLVLHGRLGVNCLTSEWKSSHLLKSLRIVILGALDLRNLESSCSPIDKSEEGTITLSAQFCINPRIP